MTSLFSVSEDANALDVLAQRYRAAFDMTKAGRAKWIEGTIELAKVLRDGRVDLPDHRAFSKWIERHNLQKISTNDRWALLNIGDLSHTEARKLLEETRSYSYELIWRKRPNRTLQINRKGPLSHNSGASKRKRAARIPDVMRDDNPPPPKPVTDLSKHFLTREQVDPDFKGTALEFATAYGHVPLHTKQQIEYNKRQEALMAWIGTIADHERTGRAMLAALPAVDPATLKEWMAKPGKADKINAWSKSIQVACEALYNMVQS